MTLLAVLFLVAALVFVVGGFFYVTGLWVRLFRHGVKYAETIKAERRQ